MQPKFIDLPEKKVVGLGTKFISIFSPDKNNMTQIPALWQQFMKQTDKIPHKTNIYFGLIAMLPITVTQSHKDELSYIAAAEVTSFDSAPPEMIRHTIQAGRYACFTHKGTLITLEKTMNLIYKDWLPTSGTPLRIAPHLELYDHRFIPDSENSEFDILLPIQ